MFFVFTKKFSTSPTSTLCKDNASMLYNDGRKVGSTKSKMESGVFRRVKDGFVILEKPSLPGNKESIMSWMNWKGSGHSRKQKIQRES